MAIQYRNEQVSDSAVMMGDSIPVSQMRNVSGEKVPYTIMQPRDQGRPAGDIPGTGTQAHREPELVSPYRYAGIKQGVMGDLVRGAADGQYAQIPGLVDRVRSGYASPHEVGMHVGMSNQNTRALHWLFGGQECC